MKIFILLFILTIFIIGCKKKANNMETVNSIFESELKKQNIKYKGPDKDGLYNLEIENFSDFTVSLDNISREYRNTGRREVVVNFVKFVLKPIQVTDKLKWEQVESKLYFSVQPSNMMFDDTVVWKVTDSISKILAIVNLEDGSSTWVTHKMLADWKISEEKAVEIAQNNMDLLLKDISPQLINDENETKVGAIPVSEPLKASMIFAPAFKNFITQKLDWPVLVMIPDRGFMYVLANKDSVFLNQLGSIIQKEYRTAPHPLTTEVLLISDEGIKAAGKFPE